MTQEEIAGQLGVSRQTIAKWEAGESVPDLLNAAALAKCYDVSIDALFEQNRRELKPRGKHLFGIVRINEKRQISLPQKACEVFELKPGDRLVVLGDEQQGIALIKSDQLIHFAKQILKSAKEVEEDA
jgi:AbrB family looped-hinge helix DNA binding protein